MKGSDLKHKGKSLCSIKVMPAPEFITCMKCGEEIELWSDEEETRCLFCGHKVFRKEATLH